MKKLCILLGLCWLVPAFTGNLFSQTAVPDLPVIEKVETISDVYSRETIYLSGDMRNYTKNGQEKRVGFFAKRLKTEFDSCSTESKTEMQACIKSRKRGALLTGSGGLLLTGGLFLTVVAPPVGLAVVLTGLVPYSLGAVKLYESGNQLQKAIWLRNRDVLEANK